MTSFEQAKEVLKRYFGHDEFRPEQERAIKAIMGKRDVLAVMSTGAGKSLIYQVPAVALGGTTIVVSPLVSLMSDQVKKLVELGLRPAFLNNTLSLRAQETVRSRIKSGEFQILYVAPERLSNPAFLSAIGNLTIPLVAVDEAHCISEWGHDFRSDYREISAFIERFDQRPTVVALTATPRVRRDIIKSLGLQSPLEIVSSFDRANLSLSVVHMPHDERESWCVRTARSRGSECGIFYCVTISETERIHDALRRAGVPAALYHGKLGNDEKRAAQEAFMSGRAPVMVATSVLGMGIDKPDVRYVVCCGMPLSVESYYQQIGRAGRDGKPGDTIMLWDEQDLQTALFMAEAGGEGQNDPQRSRQKGLAFDMRDFCRDENTCRRDLILRYFGEKPPDDGGCGRCDNCAAPVDGIVRAEDARPLTDSERNLFVSLKSACAVIAEGGGVGGALTERTLRGICRKRPRNLEQLLRVNGMTAKAAQAYGAQILAVVETGGVPASVKPLEMPNVPEELSDALIATIRALGSEARRAVVLKVACGKSEPGAKANGYESLPCWGSAGPDRSKAKHALDALIACGIVGQKPGEKCLCVVGVD
ncbi:MAG: RecQ family ATP-dependent DNA helicase [Senegalimassilia sp.]|uniref:RecQ family ATP-dependent DNA helicase n=1 Tax=Senegalimassilia sp. TaxID=1922200 RepID=UPI002850642A|nr:RecQ family ATP-dependent DNA helicase [Senegalimassilia sp.]MDR4054586.1 RecQ family ATP-dependent DNA helicase [Senegalimassilia sp.]